MRGRQEDAAVLKDVQVMLDYLEDRLDQLNRREAEFVEDLSDQMDRENTISERQLNWLWDLYDRV